MAIYVVDTLVDENDGSASIGAGLSLRDAVALANANDGVDTVVFDDALDGGTVTLTFGQIEITDGVFINGNNTQVTGDESDDDSDDDPAADGITVSGNGASRIFSVDADGTTLRALALTDGATSDGTGGGAILHTDGTLVLESVQLTDNAVTGAGASGGAIRSSGELLAVYGSELSGNSAIRAGGAIELDSGADLEVRASSFTGNSVGAAPGNGGAIHVTAGGSDVDIALTTFNANSAASEGGAVWNDAGSTMTIRGSTIVNNTADGDEADNGGGGIFNNGGDLRVEATRIAGNDATGAAGSGGGLLSVDGTVEVYGTTFNDNAASRAGGGIEIIDGTLEVLDTVFINNVTGDGDTTAANPGNGGAIHVTGTSTTTTIENVFAVRNFASSEGGAFWNQDGSTMEIYNTRISDNQAGGDAADNGGGGVFNNGGDLTIAESRISGNLASGVAGSGGGVLSVDGTVEIANGSIRDNSAARAGGGLEVIDGTVVLDSMRLSGNIAGDSFLTTANPGNGGAVHVSGTDGTLVEVFDSHIFDNVASSEGGGLWNQDGSTMRVFLSNFIGNTANGDAADNGGGALFNNGGTMEVFGSQSRFNLADGAAGSGGAILNDGGDLVVVESLFDQNDAARAGGAIESTGGTVDLSYNYISYNTVGSSPGNGGGVHASGTGDLSSFYDTFLGNFATNEGGGLWTGPDVAAEVDYGIFVENATDGVGGGIFVIGGGEMDVTNSKVIDNFAARGDGIFVSEEPGDDGLSVRSTVLAESEIFGSEQADRLIGDGAGDFIFARGGDDAIIGRRGDDLIYGGGGSDRIVGNSGRDEIFGNRGNDVIGGGRGADTIEGNAGADLISGASGDDRISGGFGFDTLRGGAGDDTVNGGAGDDVLFGGFGNDLLIAGAGDDDMTGGGGFDTFAIYSFGISNIADFVDDVDTIGLAGDLAFSDLSFSGQTISAGGQVVAVLSGFNTTTLTQDDFTIL